MMFYEGNRSYVAPLSVLFLLILITLAACQTTPDDTASEPQADLAEPTDPPVPTEEPTDLPAPTEEPTDTLVATAEPTEEPPTSEPTEEPPTPTKEPSSPTARGFHAMAYDSESDRIILFGGELTRALSLKASGATWAYDVSNNLWTRMRPAKAPVGAMGQVMAYDSESDRVIMLGGWDSDQLPQNTTWIYDYKANSWSEGSAGPEIGGGSGMVYDSESDRMITFGGYQGGSLDETWAYDANTDTWENMEPSISPPGRRWHNMVYDAKSDRVILWEGETAPTENVWTYDYNANTWVELGSDGVLSIDFFEGFGAMVYDSESDRSISYGGGTADASMTLDDLWIYDYNTNTWTEMEPDAGPGKRFGHEMAYNSALDLVVLFGGMSGGDPTFGSPPYNQETWVYDLNTNTWTNMTAEQD